MGCSSQMQVNRLQYNPDGFHGLSCDFGDFLPSNPIPYNFQFFFKFINPGSFIRGWRSVRVPFLVPSTTTSLVQETFMLICKARAPKIRAPWSKVCGDGGERNDPWYTWMIAKVGWQNGYCNRITCRMLPQRVSWQLKFLKLKVSLLVGWHLFNPNSKGHVSL